MIQKLLLIDENAQMLALVGDFLAHRGYEVHRACECDEAVALLKHYQYSIVITGAEWEDVGGSGSNLTQYLQKLPYQPQVVRLEENRSHTCTKLELGDGATLVIEKPNSLLRLGDLMHELTNA